MLKRGLVKRCPRCGAGHLFQTWWRMRSHCPRCGMRFEREEGYFTGVMLVNLTIVEGLVFAVTMAFMLALAANGDASVWWPLGVGGAVSVLAPVVFYPFARTIWFAIDLAMRPLELAEIVEAAEVAGAGDEADAANPHRGRARPRRPGPAG